ncbi:PDZ/DHR/GLGF domain-containing protein [Calothrix sp. NIES-4071]|nr:PDZ/DHR/GLGF domain-containing protein [Calothrix sp. NIES-4071]BAZ59419.1 PDZ/DHR/GLGF domain-containing protein [Calothrix sp. NIES-4105]
MSISSNAPNLLLSLSQSLADIVELSAGAVVSVNAGRRFSPSGIHWRNGIIVTSDESLHNVEDITVTIRGGKTVPAKLLGRDASTDIAVFQISNPDIPVANIGDATTLKVGHLVLGMALSREGDIKAAMGTISVCSGTWKSMSGGNIDQFIRPDITLYPGFAGGPLVDANGNVVGMNTSGRRATALTIPSETVNRVVDQLVAKGRIAKGYLGVGMQPVRLPKNLLSSLNLSSDGGVIVVNIDNNAPAEQAGILLGDILITFDGARVQDTNDILGYLNQGQSVNQSVSVQIIRGGELVNLTVTVGERPF